MLFYPQFNIKSPCQFPIVMLVCFIGMFILFIIYLGKGFSFGVVGESGLNHQPAKLATAIAVRRFESFPLRHQTLTANLNPALFRVKNSSIYFLLVSVVQSFGKEL